jgi:hypothetical protein
LLSNGNALSPKSAYQNDSDSGFRQWRDWRSLSSGVWRRAASHTGSSVSSAPLPCLYFITHKQYTHNTQVCLWLQNENYVQPVTQKSRCHVALQKY